MTPPISTRATTRATTPPGASEVARVLRERERRSYLSLSRHSRHSRHLKMACTRMRARTPWDLARVDFRPSIRCNYNHLDSRQVVAQVTYLARVKSGASGNIVR